MTDHSQKQPFDEQAALAELERLREAIAQARRAREAASDEFDRFVRGFRTPPPESAQERVTATSRVEGPTAMSSPSVEPVVATSDTASSLNLAPPALPTPALAPVEPAVDAPAVTPSVTVPEPAADTTPFATEPEPRAEVTPLVAVSETEAEAASAPPHAQEPRSRRWFGAAVVGLLVILAAIAWAVFASRTPDQPPASSTSAPAQQQPREAPTPAPAPSSPAAPPVTSAAVSLELTAVNPVWIRVVIDGQKALEDTIPAGQRLQFSGDRSIVVRAGSGGDLMVRSGGREEPFGVAGQPLTRTFAPFSAGR